MPATQSLKALGFSQYEAGAYISLVAEHPVNGSQLSRISGIARSRIYDVLRSLNAKGYVLEVDSGTYVPLPPDELINRLENRFAARLQAFKDQIARISRKNDLEYVWNITGYDTVMEKAKQMIDNACDEIYVRLFPQADRHLGSHLSGAAQKGVHIRYIAMGEIKKKFKIQVTHPDHQHLEKTIGGRSIEVIVDKKEALVGVFETGNEENSPINWTRNQRFIVANRDSLRHDFYHSFLEKMVEQKETLTKKEQEIYKIIKKDN